MPLSNRSHLLAVPTVAALLFFGLAGCQGKTATGAAPKTPAAEGAIKPTPVSDDAFATSVHKLLRDGKPSAERLNLLAGVVSRQLAHASERFAVGQQDRGLASLSGAFLLVRPGEFRMEMVAGREQALASALAIVAPRGDEGRSLAFLTMQKGALANANSSATAAAKAENEGHLAALQAWLRDTQRANDLESLGDNQRVQASLSMTLPTGESLAAAREATARWIDQSLKLKEGRPVGNGHPTREDTMEVFRALRSGAESLAALDLRQGDARGAISDLERTAASKVTPPSLAERLDRAANGGEAGAWRDLLAWLWSPDRKDSAGGIGPEADPEFQIDPNLLRGALFGTAVEAYRVDPTVADVNMLLSTLLVQMGLPEAAPFVLADAATSRPDAAVLSGALGLVLQTILREDDAEDTVTARRVFSASDPLLALASTPPFVGRVEPSAARLKLAMGTIETRAGDLAHAQTLLESSNSVEPSVEAMVTLAAIDRQAGKSDSALTRLTRALATPEAQQNPLAAGEAHLHVFEIQKDLGAADKAKLALTSALSATLDARKRAGNTILKGHAERLLARVLFRFSDTAGASRATERAFAAAGQDKHELAAVVLDSTQRAFLRKDVAAARTAVSRGLAGELADEDLVYAALWLLFAEKDARARSDGTASRALASIKDDGSWQGRLSAWALGRLKDAELVNSARTVGQKTEASFYIALAKKIAGDVAADTALAAVAKSQAIDLVEVQLARDLLAGPARFANGPTPQGVAIP